MWKHLHFLFEETYFILFHVIVLNKNSKDLFDYGMAIHKLLRLFGKSLAYF